ncbi:Phosphocholine hydrolase Lem3 [Orchesella cincta]|uniref:Phosphocholine hydrolase Lem3 n=1 Tax=Orchesella cincta TaxID=48709 RepID=A0A1D2M7Q5_ORCCI|nr:Phosphocholine hydrolase Lem3 [Orchesella cincta]
MSSPDATSSAGETPATEDAEVAQVLNSILESAASSLPPNRRIPTVAQQTTGHSQPAATAMAIAGFAPSSSTSGPVTYRLLPRIPEIRTDLRYSPYNAVTFVQHLYHVFSTWTPPYLEAYGIRTLLDALMTKIYRDSDRRYNLLLADANICISSSVGEVWYGPGSSQLSHPYGIRFRIFLQVNGKPYVLFIFDQRPTCPGGMLIEFQLEYMHQKYKNQQIRPLIFQRSTGIFETGVERVTFTSPLGVEFTYPKVLRFHRRLGFGGPPSPTSSTD